MADGAPRARPAHPSGPTFCAFTPNGRKIITTGSNDSLRIFKTGSDDEPTNIDNVPDSSTALVAANDFFIVGSEDGAVSRYSLQTNEFEDLITRCSLPIRDLTLSPDRQWLAVASDELGVKIVNLSDLSRVKYLRDQPKPAKHVTFDYSGSIVTVSGSDGIIYVFQIDTDEPKLLKKIVGEIRALETDDEAVSRATWHPDGRAFGVGNNIQSIQTISKRDWENQRAFSNEHHADITALSWSPNGALLVSASKERKVVLWETKTQKALHSFYHPAKILSFSWHPTENILSYTNNEGELYMHQNFVPSQHVNLLEQDLQPAPFIHDPLGEISGNSNRPAARVAPRDKEDVIMRDRRRGTPDSLDEILGPMDDDNDFVEDDDGAGYGEVVNGNGKRSHNALVNGSHQHRPSKRHATDADWTPQIHDSFQPGSTPWRGNRRYLCLNLVGCVWTVDQDDMHYTVTVEFYDRDEHRDFHFTDPYTYDKACLTDKGALFSNQPADGSPAHIFYRPHEHWTSERPDWKTELPQGEYVTSIALSESFVVVATSAEYVRIYTLFGTPLSVFRQKSAPMVTCTAWKDYILTIGNGPIQGDGMARLQYSIQNIKHDEVCQNEDTVALPEGSEVRNVFFSESGDPCIYDSEGVLLVLQHWRTPGQARWVPLLDTKLLGRLADGRKDETYWPVAVAQDRFYCIILKGGDKYPYFPRPLLSEFEFSIPIKAGESVEERKRRRKANKKGKDGENEDAEEQEDEVKKLEETYLRASILYSLADDLVGGSTNSSADQRQVVAQKQLEVDKVLLQLLAAECVAGEERGMKALEIVGLFKDRSGRMMDAAGKIASRFGRGLLREKIDEIAERRLVGLDGDE